MGNSRRLTETIESEFLETVLRSTNELIISLRHNSLQTTNPDANPRSTLLFQSILNMAQITFATLAGWKARVAPTVPNLSHQTTTMTECDTSTGYASEIESAPDSTSHQPSQWTIKLLATLNDDICWLYDYSQETTKHTIRNKRRNTSDERIKDILRVEGARGHPSNEDKIFRALAQRSMGIQFTGIQREKAQREHPARE